MRSSLERPCLACRSAIDATGRAVRAALKGQPRITSWAAIGNRHRPLPVFDEGRRQGTVAKTCARGRTLYSFIVPVAPGGLAAMRVLVADDSKTMRQIIIRSLATLGASRIAEAADGNEALALFQPGLFDLVLTDWNMPGKNGLEVVQGIRAQDAQVPIIMVTTEAEQRRVVQAIEAGVSDYLLKPFSVDLLRAKLARHAG